MTLSFEWDKIQATKPLVHHITNEVTVNDCANIALTVGGSPVMAYAPEEVSEMTAQSQALVLNIGTLTELQVTAMIRAGRAANEKQIPVVLDPVGVGATSFRIQSIQTLVEQVNCSVIRGNASEMATLCGLRQGKGVDASNTDLTALMPQLRELAKQLKTVIAVSGEVDVITDGMKEAQVSNGTVQLTQVTGTGCMTTTLIGCCLGAGIDPFSSAVTSLVAMGLVGEWAEQKSGSDNLGTFRTQLFNGFFHMNNPWLQQRGNVYVTSYPR